MHHVTRLKNLRNDKRWLSHVDAEHPSKTAVASPDLSIDQSIQKLSGAPMVGQLSSSALFSPIRVYDHNQELKNRIEDYQQRSE